MMAVIYNFFTSKVSHTRIYVVEDFLKVILERAGMVKKISGSCLKILAFLRLISDVLGPLP